MFIFIILLFYNIFTCFATCLLYHQKAIKINPEYSNAYNSLGNVYDKEKEYDKAIEAYKKAISLDKKDTYPYLNLFELQLCQNMPFDEKLKREFQKLFKDQKEKFIDYEIFTIFKNIVNKEEIKLDEWLRKYEYTKSLYELEDFEDLDEWIKNQKDNEIKLHLVKVLEIFKGHNESVNNKKEK